MGRTTNASVRRYVLRSRETTTTTTKLKASLAGIHAATDNFESAKLCRVLRLETMIEVRKTVDEVEAECPANLWSYATYKELLFLDSGKFK
jgi:glutamine synthetase